MKLISSFFYSIRQGIKGIFKNKAMSFISIISVTASLIILGIVLSVVLNINQFIKVAQDEINEIRVEVDSNLSKDDLENINKELNNIKDVKSVEYKSKDESFNEMKKDWGEDAYLLEGVENPLDDYYVVTIDNPENIKSISTNILDIDKVSNVDYYQDIMKNFLNISNTVKKFGSIFIVFLLFICLVIISNTIKARVLSKKEEIAIIKYVGASNSFVIAPFIVEGFTIGVIGSLFAIGLCLVMYSYGIENFEIIMNSIMGDSVISLANISIIITTVLLIVGISIGVLGSMVSVKKHLKV